MELAEIRLSGLRRTSEIELVPIGDVHLGTLNCDIEHLKRVVNYVARTPHCYWLGMGDYLECIKHQDSRRFDPRVIPTRHLQRLGDIAQSQKEEFVEIFAAILTPEKCWGLHRGNHENELYLHYGEDIVGQLCRQFGVRDLGSQALIRLRFARKNNSVATYVIHSQHGHGGGRKPGSKLNLLRDLPANIEADVHLMGHIHDRIIDDAVQLRLCPNALRLEAREKVFGVTGTFYRTYQEGVASYAEQRNYPPSPIGCIKVTFAPWSNVSRLHIEKLRV